MLHPSTCYSSSSCTSGTARTEQLTRSDTLVCDSESHTPSEATTTMDAACQTECETSRALGVKSVRSEATGAGRASKRTILPGQT